MDIARPEETDVPFDPLEVVEHVLTAENLPFDRTDDGDLAFAWDIAPGHYLYRDHTVASTSGGSLMYLPMAARTAALFLGF